MYRVQNPVDTQESSLIRRVAVPPTGSSPRWGSSRTGSSQFVSHLRGRRTELHWSVPPAFENPGKALQELGLELYKEACREYYAAIGDWRVENAQRLHSRWVVKRVLREFESHCRAFRRRRQDGVIVGPEELFRDGRLMVDLEHIIRRYQVREDLVEVTRRLTRLTIAKLWQIPLAPDRSGTLEMVVNS